MSAGLCPVGHAGLPGQHGVPGPPSLRGALAGPLSAHLAPRLQQEPRSSPRSLCPKPLRDPRRALGHAAVPAHSRPRRAASRCVLPTTKPVANSLTYFSNPTWGGWCGGARLSSGSSRPLPAPSLSPGDGHTERVPWRAGRRGSGSSVCSHMTPVRTLVTGHRAGTVS